MYDYPSELSTVNLTDADWAGDLGNRHSTSGNLFVMSGGAISWLSKKQPVLALVNHQGRVCGTWDS